MTTLGLGLSEPDIHAQSAPDPAPPTTSAGAPSIVPPRALTELSAEYPPEGSGDHELVVELVVGVDGVPSQVRALGGEPPFSLAAEAAVRGFRFAPAERNGRAVAAKIRLSIRFVDPTSPATGAAPPASAPPGAGEPAGLAAATAPAAGAASARAPESV
ncbi:MAG TPA: energy transducer TonB, partial [Polyangiaceae bacterium]|nr:energy transducer TonB [Polyangiaceae bacterium]